MLILFKHCHRFLTKSSIKVTASFLLKMSSNTRSLRSRALVKTEQDTSDNKKPQNSVQKSKYFQNEQMKEELGVPANNKVEKGTKKAKALKIKQEDHEIAKPKSNVPRKIPSVKTVTKIEHNEKVVKQKSNVSAKLRKLQAQKTVTKTEPNESQIVTTEVLSDNDFIPKSTHTNSALEMQKGKSDASTKTGKMQSHKSVIKTEPDVSEMVKTEVLSEDDFIPKSTHSSSTLKSQKEATENVKRKHVQKREKMAKVKTEHVQDVEDIGWQPENWRMVLDNILKMRKLHVAPVDSLGCEECPEKGVLPEVFRYQTLISVMLSSQTRDEVTYAATQRLIAHGLTVDSILETSDEKIGELIYPAGFWKSKVKYIRNTTQILKDQYSGDIPRTFQDLCKLPGVGPKMANIVMSVGWNDTVGIAVDTHVHRISNRLGWVPKPTKDPEHTRKALEAWMPKDQWRPINLTLVGFGQTICKPVGPSCENCLNSELCPFGRSTLKGKHKKMSKK